MGRAWIHDALPCPEPEDEHPALAVVALIAVLAAMLLIVWARIEVHGTADLEATLVEPTTVDVEPALASPVDDAVATGRWAAGFAY